MSTMVSRRARQRSLRPASSIGSALAMAPTLIGWTGRYTGGGTHPAMVIDINWTAVLAHHATRTPERPIVVFEGESLSYREMDQRAAALAGGLQARGVE